MAFFSKNKITAKQRIEHLSLRDKYYKNKGVCLAKKQIPHIAKWKTFKIIELKGAKKL